MPTILPTFMLACVMYFNPGYYNLSGVWVAPNNSKIGMCQNDNPQKEDGSDVYVKSYYYVGTGYFSSIGKLLFLTKNSFAIEPVAFQKATFKIKGVRCTTNKVTFAAAGVSIGTLGFNELLMSKCEWNISYSCENGFADSITQKCEGTWH